jgi:hypothetical protein
MGRLHLPIAAVAQLNDVGRILGEYCFPIHARTEVARGMVMVSPSGTWSKAGPFPHRLMEENTLGQSSSQLNLFRHVV